MGACLSTSSSSRSNADLRIGCCGQTRTERTFSNHGVTMKNLASIPNRIFTNGKSRTSCIFTQQGRKGINQDAMIVWEDFTTEDVTFCGVFDGHGPHGHLVARKVRDALPVKLLSFLHAYQSRQNGSGTTCFKGGPKKSGGGELEKDVISVEEKLKYTWREAFLKSYKAMDKELRSNSNLDCFCSGSTAVTIVKQGMNLFMGYIGDSRAILGSKDNNDSMVAVQLTVDLKPDLPREAERIKQCKGRVFSLQDEPEVSRVWLPFDDAPGLAMARAFGDFCLKEYGVISMPEFSHRLLTEKDQFIVIASDGVWDVLSNDEVVNVVSSAPNRASAARTVVDSAAREWKLKYPTSKMDDCAVVCLFLDGKMDSESANNDQGSFSSSTIPIIHFGNAGESDDIQKPEPSLQRNSTVRPSEGSEAMRRLSGEMDANGDERWSGLEGVTRVNSIVQLPRFSEERRIDDLKQ